MADKENEREREVGRPEIRKHEPMRVTERQRDKTTETKIHKDTDRNKEAERKTETETDIHRGCSVYLFRAHPLSHTSSTRPIPYLPPFPHKANILL